MNNPLQPLVKALLAAWMPCHPDDDRPCPICDGNISLAALAWLAERVLQVCPCGCHSPDTPSPYAPCEACYGIGWIAKDTSDWPTGWALGMGALWRQYLGKVLAREDGLPGWWYVLGSKLWRSLHSDTPDEDCIAALVEAVKAMMEPEQMMAKPLQPYQRNRPCPKCGVSLVSTAYLKADTVRYPYECPADNPREHLERHCQNCGYWWCEGLAMPQEEHDAKA